MPSTPTIARPELSEIEQRVCDVAAACLDRPRAEVTPDARIIEDLYCDSIAFLDLLFSLERAFDVSIPSRPPNAIYKSVFTRAPIRLRDLAELIYLQWGTGRPPHQTPA